MKKLLKVLVLAGGTLALFQSTQTASLRGQNQNQESPTHDCIIKGDTSNIFGCNNVQYYNFNGVTNGYYCSNAGVPIVTADECDADDPDADCGYGGQSQFLASQDCGSYSTVNDQTISCAAQAYTTWGDDSEYCFPVCPVLGEPCSNTNPCCAGLGLLCVDFVCVSSSGGGNCSAWEDTPCGICGTEEPDCTCNDPCNAGNGTSACQSDSDCPGCQACDGGYCYDDDAYCYYGDTCQDGLCEGNRNVIRALAIGLGGDSIALTGLQQGVSFNFFGKGAQQISWSSEGSNVGWLVLDLKGNGRIDTGFELFSNIAKQPGMHKDSNGFKALAQYDRPASGGNGDGVIDQRDKVFSRLRVWVDKNHNGISDPGELLTMRQAGVQSISLAYQPMQWTDAYGNQFVNRAAVVRAPGPGADQGPWAYDVVLQNEK